MHSNSKWEKTHKGCSEVQDMSESYKAHHQA